MPYGAENAAPIDRRGWCIFEHTRSVVCARTVAAALRSASWETALPSQAYPGMESCVCAGRAARRRSPPTHLQAMLREGMEREAEEAGSGFRFTNGKDATSVCIPQYREGFLRLMAAGGELMFSRCDWGDAQVKVLIASALVYAHAHGATSQAEELHLSCMQPTWLKSSISPLNGGSLLPLAEAMAAGALPELKIIRLEENSWLGDADAAAIAVALSSGRLPKLEELWLQHTGVGDAGAIALAGALAGAPNLEFLYVHGHAMPNHPEGVWEVLEAAAKKQGRVAFSGDRFTDEWGRRRKREASNARNGAF